MLCFFRALKELVEQLDSEFGRDKDFYIGFEGSFGAKHVTPRSLSARNLNNLICLEGIVTKCSLVRPKVTKSVHYCPATKKSMERMYTDLTSLEAYPSSGAYPVKDEEGNPLETEYGLFIVIPYCGFLEFAFTAYAIDCFYVLLVTKFIK